MSVFKPSALISEQDLELIREELGLTELELVLSDNWSNDNPTHRQQIREHLLNLSDKELRHHHESLSNLGQVPDLSTLSMSISHCHGMGGYALTKRPFQIGFDIEETTRMNPQVVRRVCEEASEVEAAPSPAHLWVAKESSFKALLGVQQPSVIGDITIVEWKDSELLSDAQHFVAVPLENQVRLRGLSLQRDDYHLGISCLSRD